MIIKLVYSSILGKPISEAVAKEEVVRWRLKRHIDIFTIQQFIVWDIKVIHQKLFEKLITQGIVSHQNTEHFELLEFFSHILRMQWENSQYVRSKKNENIFATRSLYPKLV